MNERENNMKGNKTAVRTVLIFTLIMGIMTLMIMLSANAKQSNNTYITVDPTTMKLVQLDEPSDGAPIAIVDTTLGEFRFVLYPQYSPNAVKNFTELAESGYYDGTYVFDSVSGAYSSAGAPNKDGSVNDRSHEAVERELHENLWPFKGAICTMTTSVDRGVKEFLFGGGKYFNGSRFTIINTVEFDDQMKEDIREVSESKELGEAFIEKGGIPNFSQQMTVIGQTYEGLDVVEKLASLETSDSGSYSTPKEDIMINSVKIDKFSKNDQPSKD